MNDTPRHGVDGWDLYYYRYNEESGESLSVYERWVYGMREEKEIYRQSPWHTAGSAPS